MQNIWTYFIVKLNFTFTISISLPLMDDHAFNELFFFSEKQHNSSIGYDLNLYRYK